MMICNCLAICDKLIRAYIQKTFSERITDILPTAQRIRKSLIANQVKHEQKKLRHKDFCAGCELRVINAIVVAIHEHNARFNEPAELMEVA